jgi:hypothetical protein
MPVLSQEKIMKRTLLSCLGVALMATTVVGADGRGLRTSLPLSLSPALVGQNDISLPPQLSPIPDPAYAPSGQYSPSPYSPSPYSIPAPASSDYVVSGAPVEVYQNVKYRAVRNIAPCAVPTIIQVPDPCNKNACCKTCVNVQVCVPPCEPAKVKVTRDGRNVKYDYGKYAVSVRSIGNHVVVHYED